VQTRVGEETGEVVWTPPPPDGTVVHFDVVYVPAGANATLHPGARSMGTGLVGQVWLANGERVFVTSVVRPIGVALRANVARLRSGPVFDFAGNPIQRPGMLAFHAEPNPDADDGTSVGVFVDVTRPEAVTPRPALTPHPEGMEP
jgi:hypothetical protein